MKTKLLPIILMLLVASLYGQRWVELMNEENVNYYKVKEEAEKYFKENGTDKGSGYKQYKRWEYEMLRKMDKDGYILKEASDDWSGFKKYEARMAASKLSRTAQNTQSNWVELGPDRKNPTSGWNPGVGRVTCVAVNPSNQNVLYVGSPGGGCWKSINGGLTWASLTDNLPFMKIYSISLVPSNPNIVYMGTDNGLIMKSTDAGATWVNVYNDASAWRISKILIHPTQANTVLAATSAGVIRSTNGGTSWVLVSANFAEDLEFKPGNPSVVYGSGNSGFLKSTNGGVSFTVLSLPSFDRTLLAVTPANPEYVYLVQARGSEFGALYFSDNSGQSFATQITGSSAAGTNFFGYESSGTGTGGQAWYDMAICASPTNASEIIIAGIICWKSTNKGLSFSPLTEWFFPNSLSYNHADVHALEYVGSTIYSGSDGGVYKSVNGGTTWTDLSAGLGIRQAYRLGSCASNGAIISSGSQDNGTSVRGSTGVWKDWLGADGMETLIHHSNPNIMYGTSQLGGMYKSTDGGQTNSWIGNPNSSFANWITPWVMHPTNPDITYVGVAELYRSDNGGSSWTQLSNFGYGAFIDVEVAASNPNYIYGFVGGKLVVTKNGGQTWSEYTHSFYANDIAVSPTNPEKVVVASFNGVYQSNNAGQTFTNITGSLPPLYALSATIQKGSSEGIYLGMAAGVYYKNNNMSDWIPYMEHLPYVEVNELEINYTSNKILAATYGRGIWESPLYENVTEPLLEINGPSCVSTGQPVTYQLRSDLLTNATSQQWWVAADASSNGSNTGTSYTFTPGQYYTSGANVCAGVNYNVSPWYKTYCRALPLCNARVVEEGQEFVHEITVYPNPSSNDFTLRTNQNIASVMLVNSIGKTVFAQKRVEGNADFVFGNEVPAGLYHLVIEFTSGKKEVRIIEKIK
ncbi:MAG: T9SS type A sorting domain-containing protein [Cytophagaceae bacterium]|jgi:photosystem II stability/assembly factor-like uncharacterized protein|nr:T9SS type A sorting domain-containing protein [Cytophagaceae bacterium]